MKRAPETKGKIHWYQHKNTRKRNPAENRGAKETSHQGSSSPWKRQDAFLDPLSEIRKWPKRKEGGDQFRSIPIEQNSGCA
jgi:hypothetical protein